MEEKIKEIERRIYTLDMKNMEQDKVMENISCHTKNLDKRFTVLLLLVIISLFFSVASIVISLIF